MKRTRARDTTGTSYSCTKRNPCPPIGELTIIDESRWTHPSITTVYEGSLYDELECPHCGRTWKAAK